MSEHTPAARLLNATRRRFLATCAAAAAGIGLAARPCSHALASGPDPALPQPKPAQSHKYSLAAWCFPGFDQPALCNMCQSLGISSIELVGLEWWPVLKERGIGCAVAVGPTKTTKGPANPDNHPWLHKRLGEMLPRTADAGCPAMVLYSGSNAGHSDAEGLTHCVEGLKKVVTLAENSGVTLLLAIKNSKRDHPDYLLRYLSQGVEVVQRVGSPRVKLLCNIYDMQVMEGDIIRSVTQHIDHIGHFQFAGVPGRHEIHQDQELNYRAIARAIRQAKRSDGSAYDGYIGFEFQPTIDAREALKLAIQSCCA